MSQAVAHARARTAIWVTCGLYLAYALLRQVVPGGDEYVGLALIAAFYLLPGWALRREPDVAARYQVGVDGIFPRWSWSAAKMALVAVLVVFPPFVLAFFFFYARVCHGDTDLVAPLLWVEELTPWAGRLEGFWARLCRGYGLTWWPTALRVPEAWTAYFGFGAIYEVAVGVFAVALPEEIFHRGYLMSALEERWPPKRRLFGVPFGAAALLSSLLFAVGHLVGMAEPVRLATFFPALAFAWLWRRSGSLWTPALFHAGSNLLMQILMASTFTAR